MKPSTDRGAVDILEEAVHLLRSAPVREFLPCLIGILPFGLALLWFTAETSWSAFASEHLLETSFALALLFCWKQVWEAVFCVRIHALVTGSTEPWSSARILRMITVQAALQPLALLAIPLAATLMVPFATTFAYFRNLSLYAGLGSVHAGDMARQQAMERTKQNWMLHALLAILALLVLVNFVAAFVLIPQLAKSIFGVENTITRYPMWLFTSTGFVALGILTYVALEPLVTTIYVLRCFYGQSVHTGADIRSRFRRIVARAASIAVLFIGLAIPSIAPAQTAAGTPPAVARLVDPKDLNRSIENVVRRREFTWRMPKQDDDGKPRTGWAGWLDGLFSRLGEFWDWMVEGLRKFFASDQNPGGQGDKADPWAATLRYSLWALGIVFAVGAAVLLYKQSRARKQAPAVAAAGTPAPLDLRDESLTADKLPESSWLAMAQEWIDKGDLRLALRAMHLAGLSYLNGRSLVTVQRWKSGMEYSAELARRGRSAPAIGTAFDRNIRIFEAGWYGRHHVSPEALAEYSKGLDEVRSHANRL